MKRSLLIIAFVLSVAANSFAAVAQVETDPHCRMACCKAPRTGATALKASRLCCVIHCTEPGGTNSSPIRVITAPEHEKVRLAQLQPDSVSEQYLKQSRFPHSPTHMLAGCTTRYLETGALLI